MLLRPIEPEDLELLYTIENDETLWDCSNADGPFSHYALKKYIAEAATIHECGQLRLVIDIAPYKTKKSPTLPIGLIDLTNYNALAARAEVGITLLKEHRGKGLGTEALQLIEKFAVERLRIHSLHAYVSPHNIASTQLFEKANYNMVATLPDWHYNKGKYEDVALFLKIF